MPRKKRILIVDDEERNRAVLETLLAAEGHETETAADGLEALAKVKLDIDLVLLDVMMPGMDGFEVARRIRKARDTRDLPIIMCTALTGKTDRLRAVEVGANDFIAKPVDRTELHVRIGSLLKVKAAQDALKEHKAKLEKTVENRTRDLRKALAEATRAHRQVLRAYQDTVYRLGVASEYRDEDTGAHIHRISNYCRVLAQGLRLPFGEVELVSQASPMHDVGKIGVPDHILLKPGKLTPEEFDIIKTHTTIGGRILGGASSDLIRAGEVIAMAHHEKWDGSGYPKGLTSEDIPLSGRICALADVFDALTSDRPYKKAFPNEKALEIMKEGRAKHFDPEIVDIFLERTPEILAIREKHNNGGKRELKNENSRGAG